MRFRLYLWRGAVFGWTGIASTLVNIFLLWLLTQLGLWYLYSGLIGTIVAGVVHYNLNVVSGNISVAGRGRPVASAGGLRGIQAECGCIIPFRKWNLICPNCENCIDHCDC